LWGVKQIIRVRIVKANIDQNRSLVTLNALNVMEFETLGKKCSKQKDKGKKEETSGAANIAGEKEKFYDVESILVVSEKHLVISGFFIRVLYFIFILI